MRDRKLLCFALCLVLFQFADASLVPLVSENIGRSKVENSSLQITGLIVTAQLVVMFLAPWVGYLSEGYGRKPLLLLGFGIEAARSVLFASTTTYSWLLVGQFLGGVTSAIVEVLVIVIITDLTARTGRFNLVSGAVTMLMGITGAISIAMRDLFFTRRVTCRHSCFLPLSPEWQPYQPGSYSPRQNRRDTLISHLHRANH